MSNSAPFTVLLSVYSKNLPDQLNQAIKSIWTDQKLKPSQIIIVKDGELTVPLNNVIHYWKESAPSVFTIINLPLNLGLGPALNEGLKYCDYDLIARMDADDVSLPDRFIKQYNFLLKHPSIDVLGGQVEEWDEKLENRIAQKTLPLTHAELEFFTKYRCPFNHPTVMFKKKKIIDVGGYPNCKLEDNYLWIKLLLAGAKFSNLQSIVVKMRAGEMIRNRRGLSVLLPEIKLQRYLYDSGINTFTEFIVNCSIRIVLRLLPHTIRFKIYQNLR